MQAPPPPLAAIAQPPAAPTTAPAEVLRRYSDTHASQGVAVDATSLYAVSNSHIAKFDKASGAKGAEWTGDPMQFPHINACAVIDKALLCASSNYPKTPMQSAILSFDPVAMTLTHIQPLPDAPGSVTWVDRHAGRWWAGFANYDGRGGEPGRDHTATALVVYDDAWRPVGRWRFPPALLDRFAPHSTSGGGWGADGLLYVTGHDKPELYALRLPRAGDTLELVATVPVAVEGQAVAWDHGAARQLYGVSRKTGEVIAMRIPPVAKP